MRKLRFIGFLVLVVSGVCFGQPKYEFRAAWVASVENIDWPSRKGLPADSQRAEFIRLLDMHRRNGLNALVVQMPYTLPPTSRGASGLPGSREPRLPLIMIRWSS
jgi:hypothetical protein